VFVCRSRVADQRAVSQRVSCQPCDARVDARKCALPSVPRCFATSGGQSASRGSVRNDVDARIDEPRGTMPMPAARERQRKLRCLPCSVKRRVMRYAQPEVKDACLLHGRATASTRSHVAMAPSHAYAFVRLRVLCAAARHSVQRASPRRVRHALFYAATREAQRAVLLLRVRCQRAYVCCRREYADEMRRQRSARMSASRERCAMRACLHADMRLLACAMSARRASMPCGVSHVAPRFAAAA